VSRPSARRWIGPLVALVVLYGGASWWASTALLTPRGGRDPADPGVPTEAMALRTEDDLELRGWVVEPDGDAAATALVFHGMDGDRSSPRLGFLRDLGLRAVAVDLRAHGRSGGRFTGFGFHERLDVLAVADFARRRWPDEPLVAWGASLGAAALVYAVAGAGTDGEPKRPPPAFAAVILESLYTDVDLAFAQRIRLHFGDWMMPFARLPRWLAERRAGLDARRLRPVAFVHALAGTPVLFACGADDRRSTPDETRRLAAEVPGARVAVLPGLGHVDLFARGGADYRGRVRDFLLESLGR